VYSGVARPVRLHDVGLLRRVGVDARYVVAAVDFERVPPVAVLKVAVPLVVLLAEILPILLRDVEICDANDSRVPPGYVRVYQASVRVGGSVRQGPLPGWCRPCCL